LESRNFGSELRGVVLGADTEIDQHVVLGGDGVVEEQHAFLERGVAGTGV
jgi:hypothetical protein